MSWSNPNHDFLWSRGCFLRQREADLSWSTQEVKMGSEGGEGCMVGSYA